MSKDGVRRAISDEVKKTFRPEFLNRIDEIIIFNKLTEKDIEKIVELQLKTLAQRLEARNIKFEVDKKAKDKLAKEGYDPDFGARPLKRLIQREIEDKLALELLDGKYKDGSKVAVSVDEKTGGFKV
jgi:ATP-dependent Clp protease ATP-binding subunit ClpA